MTVFGLVHLILIIRMFHDKLFDFYKYLYYRESGLCENKKLLQAQAGTGQFEDFWLNQRSTTTQERKPV